MIERASSEADREIGSGHPVDEIPFQHGGIPRNDLTPLVGSEKVGVGQGCHQIVDGLVNFLLNGFPQRFARGLSHNCYCAHGSAP